MNRVNWLLFFGGVVAGGLFASLVWVAAIMYAALSL